LYEADEQLRNAEYDLNFIRGKVEAIDNDAYLKADWKGWLKDANRGRGGDG